LGKVMLRFLQFLNSIYPLSEQHVQHLSKVLKTQTFAKKSFLLKTGQICNHIYFIETGLARCFYIKDGIEISSWFMKEGDMIISVESFLSQKESHEAIQALEDMIVHYVSYEELQFIYKNFLEFNIIGRVLTEKYYTLSEQRLFSLRMMRAQERYDFMSKNHQELIQRVPSLHIASYLGITKETLSRIRARNK
jgi:CRP-like cAMP-binding protein